MPARKISEQAIEKRIEDMVKKDLVDALKKEKSIPKLPSFAEVKSAVEKEAGFLLGRTDYELLKLEYIYLEQQLHREG
jgi:hypothetical protein